MKAVEANGFSMERAGMDSGTEQIDGSERQLTEPVSILMPVCNERDVIERVTTEWIDAVVNRLPDGSELIFEDCSTDGTAVILEGLAKRYAVIRTSFHERDGFFNAAIRLYRAARCPLVFFTDSDGQYIAAQFWKLAQYIEQYDIVHGCKAGRQDPLYRLAASKTFNLLAQRMFRTELWDVNSAFRLMRRSVLEQILPKVRHMQTLINAELLIRAGLEGFKIKSVPVEHRRRESGKSRGLPSTGFFGECLAAYRGLRAIEAEYAKPGGST